jgi:hypothetical protein
MSNPRVEQASALMTRFVERTGDAKRYLWTDAFAVCNFIGLGQDELALQCIERVHRVLGHHRPDDTRTGWLSGLAANAGERQPTLGGLRIGKPLPERRPGEPMDEQLEWDRDGQYFHYLTKWMHALDRTARTTRRALFNTWACELADVAQRKFTHGNRMFWKMSIDLTRPLVASMGQHDPLDGYITCRQLAASAVALEARGPDLAEATARFAAMVDPRALATADPLGIGGLLFDAHRLARLEPNGGDLLEPILAAALVGLRHYLERPELRAPAERRLAFRELGLAIGLGAVATIETDRPSTRRILEQLAGHVSVRDTIESFWLRPEHREARTWLEHADINDVMLATSLVPSGFLR